MSIIYEYIILTQSSIQNLVKTQKGFIRDSILKNKKNTFINIDDFYKKTAILNNNLVTSEFKTLVNSEISKHC